jgi:hypothetical protein
MNVNRHSARAPRHSARSRRIHPVSQASCAKATSCATPPSSCAQVAGSKTQNDVACKTVRSRERR